MSNSLDDRQPDINQEDNFRGPDRLGQRKAVLQSRLRKHLNGLQPEKVTPAWIEEKDSGLYFSILELRKITENFSWYDFMCGVGNKWELKFNMSCQNLYDYGGMLAIILRRDDRIKWNEDILRRHYPHFATGISRNLANTDSKKCSFEGLLVFAPQIVRDRYDPSYRNIEDEIALQEEAEQREAEKEKRLETRESRYLEELTQILLDCEEPYWTPQTIEDQNGGILKWLSEDYATPYGLRWSAILEKLPTPIAERFCIDRANYKLFEHYPEEKKLFIRTRRRYLQIQLRQELEKHNPDSFSPKWIDTHCDTLYTLLQVFKKLDPHFMWHVLIEGVGQTWLDRFSTSAPNLNEEAMDAEVTDQYEREKELYVKCRRYSLQRQLKSLLAQESPTTFKPNWIEEKQGGLYNAIRELKTLDVDFTWYDFIEELGDNWIDKFTTRQENLEASVKKLEIVIRASGVETWNLEWLCKNYSALADSIRGQLKSTYKSVSWSYLFAALSEDIMQRYNGKEDDTGPKTIRVEERLRQIADQITKAVHARKNNRGGIEAWTIEKLWSEHPEIVNAARRCSYNFDLTYGILTYIPYLSNEVLCALVTTQQRQYDILAERIRREVENKFHDGWKLSDLKDKQLKKAIEGLGGKIEIAISHLPEKIRHGFIRDNRAMNRTQARIQGVIERGNDDPEIIHKLLQRTRYTMTGKMSAELITGLREEIANGNKYAITMTESIVDQALTSAGFTGAIASINVIELLMKISASDISSDSSIVMALARRARSRRGYSDKEVSLDTPLGKDGDAGFTRGHAIGAYS